MTSESDVSSPPVGGRPPAWLASVLNWRMAMRCWIASGQLPKIGMSSWIARDRTGGLSRGGLQYGSEVPLLCGTHSCRACRSSRATRRSLTSARRPPSVTSSFWATFRTSAGGTRGGAGRSGGGVFDGRSTLRGSAPCFQNKIKSNVLQFCSARNHAALWTRHLL